MASFLDAVRRNDWAPDLRGSTCLHRHDYPRPPQRLPRALDEYVMGQIEASENMARWGDDTSELIARLLVTCGRRVGEVTNLRVNCLRYDSNSNEPYLHYYNEKRRRDAYCPLEPSLAEAIRRQQQAVRQRWPDGDRALFPRSKGNPDGLLSITTGTFRDRLYRWLASCEVTTQDGATAKFTPHQWRHTFAVRLVDHDVPLTVVARLLDHETLAQAQQYGRVSDRTVQAEWQRVRKINARAEPVVLDPDEELAEAAFVAHRVARARHALANGYGRLPTAKPCEYLNPCLSCSLFVTKPDFLPVHRQQRRDVAEKLQLNEQAGRARAADKDRQDLDRLDRIIAALEQSAVVVATLDQLQASLPTTQSETS